MADSDSITVNLDVRRNSEGEIEKITSNTSSQKLGGTEQYALVYKEGDDGNFNMIEATHKMDEEMAPVTTIDVVKRIKVSEKAIESIPDVEGVNTFEKTVGILY